MQSVGAHVPYGFARQPAWYVNPAAKAPSGHLAAGPVDFFSTCITAHTRSYNTTSKSGVRPALATLSRRRRIEPRHVCTYILWKKIKHINNPIIYNR